MPRYTSVDWAWARAKNRGANLTTEQAAQLLADVRNETIERCAHLLSVLGWQHQAELVLSLKEGDKEPGKEEAEKGMVK